MIERSRACFQFFNSRWVCEARGEFGISESDPAGAGTAFFKSDTSCVLILASNPSPLVWSLLQRKCADGAFLTFDDQGAHLHIVELKGKLTKKAWAHVIQQFEGMFLTSVAIARLLDIRDFASVTCYIAASEDKVTAAQAEEEPAALIKTPVGKSQTFGGIEAWARSSVQLPFDVRGSLVKGWKNTEGDTHFGDV